MKQIITFLSPFPRGMTPQSEPDQYTCPDGSSVTGRMTNEAPVRCLLRQEPTIQRVICILTPKVRETLEGQTLSTWDYFRGEIESDTVTCLPVAYENESETFEEHLLPRILEQVSVEDEIYLETTGGPRDVATQLLLLSRVLQYQGTRVAGAVYSRFETKEVENVLEHYRSFDLIDGLNEFYHYCGTNSLAQYFGKKRALRPLLEQMERLAESIVLCRTWMLSERIAAFQNALRGIQDTDDPILKTLLPIFQKKFESFQSLPDIIHWCLDNNLVLQALTIYNERMPEYLIREKGFLKPPASLEEKFSKKENVCMAMLTDEFDGFFSLGKDQFEKKGRDKYAREFEQENPGYSYGQDCGLLTLWYLDIIFRDKKYRKFELNIPISKMQDICYDYMYVKLLRNQLNHDSEKMSRSKKVLRQWFLIKYCRKKSLEDISLASVKAELRQALDTIQSIQPRK